MGMRFPRVMELWKYTPSNVELCPRTTLTAPSARKQRDKAYTMWRRMKVREAMKR